MDGAIAAETLHEFLGDFLHVKEIEIGNGEADDGEGRGLFDMEVLGKHGSGIQKKRLKVLQIGCCWEGVGRGAAGRRGKLRKSGKDGETRGD